MKTTEDGQRKPQGGVQQAKDGRKTRVVWSSLFALCFAACICFFAFGVPAQEDPLRLIEEKRLELKERENILKQDEQRLKALKKEVDDKILAYTTLLARVELALKRVEQVKGDKIENVVKAYEVMPPEDAAARIVALDNDTALLIMTRMKSKKAGAVMALIAPGKAALLTKSMTTLEIKKR